MKYIWHYIKSAFLPLIYLIMMTLTSMAITTIGNHLLWLKYILFVLCVALYAVIIGAISFQDGKDSVKVRHMNDIERRQIVLTGEDRPLNLLKEYKPYKGFIPGFVTCIPLIVLMVIHAILSNTTGANGAGVIASLIYMLFFSFFQYDLTSTMVSSTYYFSLISLPILMIITGIPYLLGAKKQMLQYKKVEDKHREIYGDKD